MYTSQQFIRRLPEDYSVVTIDNETGAIEHPHGLVDMTNEKYHSGPGYSKSMLDAIAPECDGSPLNFWDQYINPEREPREYKHCFSVGDGTHKLVLEPGTFELTYGVKFDKSAYPNALDTIADMKAELAKHNCMVSGSKPELAESLLEEAGYPRENIIHFLEQDHKKTLSGKIEISAKEYKDMIKSLQAIHGDSIASNLLFEAYVEQSFFVTDEEGVLRKCRTDAISNNGQFVIDLKTTDDVSEIGFGKTIAQRRYHVQAAWYLDVLSMLYGSDAPETFVFIAAQKGRPYDVGVHYLTQEQIEVGRRLYQRDLRLILECNKHQYWPGRTGGEPVQARLPDWAMRLV